MGLCGVREQLLVRTPLGALVRPSTAPGPWSTYLGQVAPPVPRHAAAVSSHAAVTTVEILSFRAKINRGPRHHRRQKVPTWSLASLFVRTHHNCARTAPKTHGQPLHHDHRLPHEHAKNTQKSGDLRGRATAPGGIPRPSSVHCRITGSFTMPFTYNMPFNRFRP